MIRENTDQQFIGKALIRKGHTKPDENGDTKSIISITGVFEVPNFNDFDDGDEMWICRLVLDEAIKKINYKGSTTPEDFLEGHNGVQDPNNWEDKPGYNRRGRG